MASLRILLTNDDGWDAPGLAALKTAAASLGNVVVVAPRDPHSYAGHRVTTDAALEIRETAAGEYSLSGTPADCVRVALTSVFPDVDLVIAGINRGGNLGADVYISGTVAAAREAALLGRRAIAISQFIRRDMALDWSESARHGRGILARLLEDVHESKSYWNVNLPHVVPEAIPSIVHCEPDNEPLDVRFRREGDLLHYAGSYPARPRTPGRDVETCFGGAITVSKLRL
ncbi:MAG: 5'/3'-nucleotidase SurE [Bryobacteraceae bacterium]